MENNLFDEKAKTALRVLFENFWVLRLEKPDIYQMIREREKVLRRYVEDKLGFNLIVHQHFVKLEKIPVKPKSWMGIQDFQDVRDYALFCCALAFTESREVEEQFLLSDICEDIKDMFPGEFQINWTNYNDRKSLVRVIKLLEKLSILKTVEGEIDRFALDEEQEVLYEITVYARYFMRTYPRDLTEFKSVEELLQSDWERQDDLRRKRVYRQLFLSPAVYREQEDDPDFNYIRNFRNRLSEDIEEHTSFRLELFKNAALLVAEEKRQDLTLFPDQRGIMDVVLHFAAFLREQGDNMKPDEFGNIRLTPVQLEQMLDKVHRKYGEGWSKQYREGSLKANLADFIALLKEWEMLGTDEVTGEYILRPLIGRISGHYPSDFSDKLEEETTYG